MWRYGWVGLWGAKLHMVVSGQWEDDSSQWWESSLRNWTWSQSSGIKWELLVLRPRGNWFLDLFSLLLLHWCGLLLGRKGAKCDITELSL